MTPASFIPRSQRPKAWGQRAFNAARAAGTKIVPATERQIEAQWGPARRANDLKLDVERAMIRGARDFDVRARYRNVAMLCRPTVNDSLQEIERNYRAELRHQRDLARMFAPTANPARERHLSHARLFLRWYRRFGDRDAFAAVIETLTTSVHFDLRNREVA